MAATSGKLDVGIGLKAAAAVLAAFAVTAAIAISSYAGRAPTLTIAAPKDGTGVQAATATVEGRVDPGSSIVKVDGKVVPHGPDGSFCYDAPLTSERNVIRITAKNGGKESSVALSVTRIYTDEERADAEAKAAAEAEATRKAQEEAAAKARAEQTAFDATKAGKICKRHAEWSREECRDVADGKYWIGMSADMLIEERGRNASVHVSNYGGGDRYQVCWSDWTPSCFYDNDNDGLIDAYN